MGPDQHPAFESALRKFLARCLEDRFESGTFDVNESLFLSGRLDSLAAIQLIVFLEENAGAGFDSKNITLARIDTFESILKLAAGS